MSKKNRFLPRGRWLVEPHAPAPPPGLWWRQVLSRDEKLHVLCVYFERRTYISKNFDRTLSVSDRWGRVREDFKSRCANQRGTPSDIDEVISLVTTADSRITSPQFGRFLTLEGAALKLNLKKANLYSWFRRLSAIGRELYGNKYTGPKPVDMTPEKRAAIRCEYLEKGNAKELAKRYGVAPSVIGQIVRKEKAMRRQRYLSKSSDSSIL